MSIKNGKEFVSSRALKYRRIFDSDDGKSILDDLANFCRANESTFNENSRVTDMLNGRREVFLRISNHLRLSDEDLYELFK